eukprot:5265633-Alexandrium_andersonii.AAC.1
MAAPLNASVNFKCGGSRRPLSLGAGGAARSAAVPRCAANASVNFKRGGSRRPLSLLLGLGAPGLRLQQRACPRARAGLGAPS